ncbi:sorbitol-6-phosphate dehydrogenase subunit [Microbacterium gubbeenense]|uniref:sorbitol-6-phosphate dehydrogenase subunit n=1 Tax=Microbacterium gubbeenense TaxID=159896 RepID=UPI000423774C|nr:sorbitol-6-phosphate dehydrogenase subunit [Microbacterium gubbeenense]
MSKWLDLHDKIIIVTGGASGIGAEIAKNLTANGATVIVGDLNPTPEVLSYAAKAIAADTTDRESVTNLVAETVATFGRVDGLVNNAGVNRPRLLVDHFGQNSDYEATEADFDFITSVNQKGPFLCAQAVVREFLKTGGGVIVNISSEAGVEGSAGQSLYSATKAALNGFTRSWAKELGGHGIRVVGVAPGINKRTNMNNDANYAALAYTRGLDPNYIDDDYTGSIPLGRVGEHQELADLVSYLLSDHSTYITGTTINITGGKSR